MKDVFAYIKRTPTREYLLRCSYLEIYNEAIHDLLAPPSSSVSQPVQIQGTGANVILTPHIGGSTEEAQRMIGDEVASALIRYLNYGATLGAVNFPEVDLRAITEEEGDHVRVCHVHQNIPGVLRQVNEVLSPYNVEKQYSDSKGDIAYLMADIADVSGKDVNSLREQISKTSANILTRLLA